MSEYTGTLTEFMEHQRLRIAELGAENEWLKCCGNCGEFTTVPDYIPRCRVLNCEHDAGEIQDRWPDPSGKCACPGQSRWMRRKTL